MGKVVGWTAGIAVLLFMVLIVIGAATPPPSAEEAAAERQRKVRAACEREFGALGETAIGNCEIQVLTEMLEKQVNQKMDSARRDAGL